MVPCGLAVVLVWHWANVNILIWILLNVTALVLKGAAIAAFHASPRSLLPSFSIPN